MHRRTLLPRAVLVAILVALPVSASAPLDQYDGFDSTFTTITDHYTKLEWDRNKYATNISHDLAATTCIGIFSTGPAGRLPTIKELLTILDEAPHQRYEVGAYVVKMIDESPFPDTPVSFPYWSSTPGPSANTYWTLSFATGAMQVMPAATPGAMRCVR